MLLYNANLNTWGLFLNGRGWGWFFFILFHRSDLEKKGKIIGLLQCTNTHKKVVREWGPEVELKRGSYYLENWIENGGGAGMIPEPVINAINSLVVVSFNVEKKSLLSGRLLRRDFT